MKCKSDKVVDEFLALDRFTQDMVIQHLNPEHSVMEIYLQRDHEVADYVKLFIRIRKLNLFDELEKAIQHITRNLN